MSENIPNTLVKTDWLAGHMSAPDVRIVDASWYLPDMGRDARAEYEAAHIPGAVFFDIDEISDTNSPWPHMLPDAEKFSARVRKLGLGDGNRIVVYDGAGLFSAARVWWMFKVMGHDDVAVLDGGLPKWQAEGRPLDDLPPRPQERHFTARVNTLMLRDAAQVLAAVTTGAEQIIDARGAARFQGDAQEPRPGLRSGHIPGARNVPYSDLLNPDGTLRDPAALRAVFEAAGVDTTRPAITTCGSGITAAILQLALARLGNRTVAMFDGSWSEWGAREDLPVETGPARPLHA